MKKLVKHLLVSNKQEILNRSLLNCHIKGLHSIMLLECPEKTIRLYITSLDHELHEHLALGIHPHHCALTLNCIYGQVRNISYSIEHDTGTGGVEYDRYLYQSHIIDNTMKFYKEGSDALKIKFNTLLRTGDSIFMKSSDLHTVECPQNTVNGWFVFEGKENSKYRPYTWSNSDLSKFNSEGLYQKPTWEEIQSLLCSVNLL